MTNNKKQQEIQRIINSRLFAKVYVTSALVILCATTLFWSLLSAKVQQGNADQVVAPLLFQHAATFHGALFPGQHTFLIKWPVFLLIYVFGTSAQAIIACTVGLVLITIGCFAAILYRIEKRPLVFGSLCLALASVLLMIPAEPYAGGLLPVNMAMLTTRNIEYIVYIGALTLFIKATRIRSWKFVWAVLLLILLFASDKLFLSISIGASIVALVTYVHIKGWKLVTLSMNWLVGGLLGAAGATILLWLINTSGLTHIVKQQSIGPYGFVDSVHAIALGCLYAVLGIFTNFGANPAANYTLLRNIPQQLLDGLKSPAGITFIINALILLACLYAVYQLIRTTRTQSKPRGRIVQSTNLAMLLVWTTLASIGVFIVTSHDYVVDSRYLTIALFALFVSMAVYSRARHWQAQKLVATGLVLVFGIILGLFGALHSYHAETAALNPTEQRNALIAETLQQHSVDTLVGDYWRVVPTKLVSNTKLNVLPLSSCVEPNSIQDSTAWQTNLHTHSFSYLLSLDNGLSNFPHCTIAQVVHAYGRPNQSSLVAGSLNKPKELLLFYDHGITSSTVVSSSSSPVPATILPTTLDSLENTICSNPTVMNIVAHEDDDLLFMNPDLIHSIEAGDCVRTIYITAGDSGQGQFYWLGREQGAEAAYSQMLGSKAVWIQKIVSLSSHEYITVANPKGNSHVSLIFMHLPDGDIHGNGFSSSANESLVKLENGSIKTFNSVDHQSYYSLSDLTAAITSLLHVYQPAEIRTQANYVSKQYPDHSDHIAVGNLVTTAYKQYEQQQYSGKVTIPLEFYIGYPIHGMPANVSGSDLQKKEAAYMQYAKHDSAVCQTTAQCQQSPTYGSYLTRQYQYKS
jgi:LmbE family N-acetylglucosaminyl deacetylase